MRWWSCWDYYGTRRPMSNRVDPAVRPAPACAERGVRGVCTESVGAEVCPSAYADRMSEPRSHPSSAVPGAEHASSAALRFSHQPDASRYALHAGDDLVSVLDYRDDGASLALTRAYTIPTFRGHGYAGELVARTVEHLEADRSRTVLPVCWYVAQWFDENPGHDALLHRRAAG